MSKDKLLLHICCAVCACALTEKFRQEGIEVIGYFYNPNIHPFQEFQKRLRAVEVLAEQEKLTVHYERDYGLDKFLQGVMPHGRLSDSGRCPKCYRMRLEQAAQKARELGCGKFTSTMIVSPQQQQSAIRAIGSEVAQSAGVKFRYEEITGLYPQSKEMAKKRMLYRQQYCGCIFSEGERYLKPEPSRDGLPTRVGTD